MGIIAVNKYIKEFEGKFKTDLPNYMIISHREDFIRFVGAS